MYFNKRNLGVLLCIFVMVACKRENPDSVFVTQSYWSNGIPNIVYEYSNQDTRSYIIHTLSEDSILMESKSFYDSVKHGRYRKYYPEGHIELEMNYNLDQRDGLVRGWYRGGELFFESRFEKDTLIYVKKYYKNGQIQADVNIVKGEIQGMASYYDSSGSVLYAGEWNNGRRHGVWNYYNEKGEVTDIEFYNHGELMEVKAVD